MKRRSLFGMIAGAIAVLLTKPREKQFIIHDDRLLPQMWEITDAENMIFEGNIARAKDPAKPCSMTVWYVTKNGYTIAPKPISGPWRFPKMP